MSNNALLTLTIGTHFFSIKRISARARPIILDFAKRYIKYGIQVVKRNEPQRTALAVYGAATKDREEFRFHINQLEEFRIWLRLNYITDNLIEIINKSLIDGVKVNFTLNEKWSLREYQVPVVDYLIKDEGCRARFVGIQTGFGKANSLDTKIKIPGGWSTMGEMHIGKKIIAKDGSITEVTGVFPQGKKQMYRVTFADERSVECCAEHLWKVYYVNTTINKRWRIVDTMEMLRLISMPNPRVYIDLPDPEQDEDIELPIDPYTLGVILGDGCISSKSITVTKNDQFIFDEIEKTLPPELTLNLRQQPAGKCLTYGISRLNNQNKNKYFEILDSYGLMGKLSHEKFIPKIYLNASYKQRLALIQGLLDTDGYCGFSHSIEFSSSSEQLTKDFQYLIRSIGGVAKITSRIPFYKKEGEKVICGTSYRITVKVKKPSDMFRLERKKKYTKDDNQYSESLKLKVKTVEKTEIKEAQCISIAHPDRLYVVNDFIVTHNTLSALFAVSKIGLKLAIIVRPMYIYKWVEDVQKYLNIGVERTMVVQGLGNLQALLELASKKQLDDIDIIIISNKTLQLYIKLYENYRTEILDQGYGCVPEDFFETIGAGVRLIDEVHQDFHLNFKIDLYTNIHRSISLSATLLSKDPFMEKVYEIAYPKHLRYADVALEKYINSYAVIYRIRDGVKINSSDRGSSTYSHNAFEESIIKNKDKNVLKNYLNLIKHTVDSGFYYDYKKGQRLIIFCYRTDFCQIVVDYLKKSYPSLDIRRYTADDPDENMYVPDIRVTTLGSGSTAHDVANLKTAILTVAVDSVQSNIQALGRLRKLDDITPRFFYFACGDVSKHMQYHYAKELLLKQRALTFKVLNAPSSI